MPILEENPLYIRLCEFSKKVISVLGYFDGATHLEVFLTRANELVFLEIGARTPGSFVVPVYEKTFGVNLLDDDFCIQLHQQRSEKSSDLSAAFWCRFPKRFGRVKKICPLNLSSQCNIQWHVKVGDVMSSADSILFSAADLLVYNKDYKLLLKDFEYLRNHIPFELEQHLE